MTHTRTNTRKGPSAALLLLLLGIGFATEARAESNAVRKYLFAAARLYEDLDYERALAQVRKAKAIAETPEDDVQVSLWEGVIAADLRRKEATDAFRAALLLDPNAELPVKVSPKVTEDFERLRAQALAEATAAKAPAAADRPERAAVTPLTGADSRATTAPAPYAPSATVATSRDRSLVVPLGLGGLALASGGAGAIFGMIARQQVDAARSATFQTDTAGALAQAQRSALTANVLFATAGAAALGGALTYLLGAPAPEPLK